MTSGNCRLELTSRRNVPPTKQSHRGGEVWKEDSGKEVREAFVQALLAVLSLVAGEMMYKQLWGKLRKTVIPGLT